MPTLHSIYEHNLCVAKTSQSCLFDSNGQSWHALPSPLTQIISSPYTITAGTLIAGFGFFAWLYKKGFIDCFKNRPENTKQNPTVEKSKFKKR